MLHILSCRQIFIKNESAADCIARYIDMTTFDTKVFKFACSFWVIFFFVYTNAFCKQTSSKNTQTMKYIPRVNDFCFNYYNGYISKIRIGFWCERILLSSTNWQCEDVNSILLSFEPNQIIIPMKINIGFRLGDCVCLYVLLAIFDACYFAISVYFPKSLPITIIHFQAIVFRREVQISPNPFWYLRVFGWNANCSRMTLVYEAMRCDSSQFHNIRSELKFCLS